MQERMLTFLCCPVTRSPLRLVLLANSNGEKNHAAPVISEAILFAEEDWFFPVTGGIPRLTVEAFLDYEDFFRRHLPDYDDRRRRLELKYPALIAYVRRKNKRTKESFSREWSFYDYEEDRTWNANEEDMLQRFLRETNEDRDGLRGKIIFDAGCGNGQLDTLIARQGAIVIAMDLSLSIERAFLQNTHPDAWYIQGDVQFPPLAFSLFDIVHSSGVLHHTNNTELSFSCLSPCVRPGGKYSVWLYHPRKDMMHRLFNTLRVFLSPLPAGLRYFFLRLTIYPVSYLIKKIKGSRQNRREMIIDILDWFTPEYRREHHPDEVAAWLTKRGYHSVLVTTTDTFGFNIIGEMADDLSISAPE
ncbi:MAG: class I SAM-dependent methyltransferase [Chitinophagaceae bacterium]|nr:class I SAM-dependent methyltransferase [Chitinophagaceae bacterium]